MTKSQRIFFSHYLGRTFPRCKSRIRFHKSILKLIAVVLSAQTTDIGGNKVTKGFKYPPLNDLMHADVEDVHGLIQGKRMVYTKINLKINHH